MMDRGVDLVLWGRAVDLQAQLLIRLEEEYQSALNREIRDNQVRRTIISIALYEQGFYELWGTHE